MNKTSLQLDNKNDPEETAKILIKLAHSFSKDFDKPDLEKFKKYDIGQIFKEVREAKYLKDKIIEHFIEPSIFFDPRVLSRDCDDKTLFLISWAIATGNEKKFLVGIMAQSKNWSHITPFYRFKNYAIPFDATYPNQPGKIGKLLFLPVKLQLFDLKGNKVYYQIKEINLSQKSF